MLFHIHSNTLYFTGGLALNVSLPVDIYRGVTSLVGPNGAGKSLFAHILMKGRNFRTNRINTYTAEEPVIKYIEFNDVHSWTGNSVGYYQQRYEAGMNDEVPTVAEIMGARCSTALFNELSSKLNLGDSTSKKVNCLSSGELRKLLIIDALHEHPDLLILDNPYIGLDAESRKALDEALGRLKDKGISLLLLISDRTDIPGFTDNILYAHNLTVSTTPPVIKNERFSYCSFPFHETYSFETGKDMVEMVDCTVNYGDVTILDKINWKVSAGERWSLSGPNGSGKSTLLSLVCADNPKSYSNRIALFGRRRGTGESIWDIKRNIGYVSPEIQLHFHGSGNVEHIIAGGLNDTVGLFVKPTEEQIERARLWMKHFKIEHLSGRLFRTLSSGERQLVLVARSFIKEPRLLILDEPMHALDPYNRLAVQGTIDDFLNSHPASAFIMVTHNPTELSPLIDHHLKLTSHAT